MNTLKSGLPQVPLLMSLILLLVGMSFSVSGCEPYTSVIIENQTKETLSVTINDLSVGDVAPGARTRNDKIKLSAGRYWIQAREKDGNIVFSQVFTFEEMEKIGWKIVIGAPNINPS